MSSEIFLIMLFATVAFLVYCWSRVLSDKRKPDESLRYVKKMPDLYAQIKDGKIEYTMIDGEDVKAL